jgi:hypothetical protein
VGRWIFLSLAVLYLILGVWADDVYMAAANEWAGRGLPYSSLKRSDSFWQARLAFGVLIAGSALPLASGLWVGVQLPGRRIRRYFTDGLVFSGIVAGVGVPYYAVTSTLDREELITIAAACLTVLLLTLTGGLIGDIVERFRASSPLPLLRDRVVAGVIGTRSLAGHGASKVTTIDKVGEALKALSPLLTLLASLFTAYLTYLASASAGAPGK